MDGRRCSVCNVNVDEDDFMHKDSATHRFHFELYQWNKYRKALNKDRHGVQIKIGLKQKNGFRYDYTEDVKKGKNSLKIRPELFMKHGNEVEFLCTITNKRNEAKSNVILTAAKLLHPHKPWSVTSPGNELEMGMKIELPPGIDYVVTAKFRSDGPIIGSYKIPISFNFQTKEEKPDTFTIARSLIVSIEEAIEEEEVPTHSPFTNQDWPVDVRVYPPTKRGPSDMYQIPEDFLPFLKMGLSEFGNLTFEMRSRLRSIKAMLSPGHVTAKNYRMFWHITLWLEEVAQRLMLKRYNMMNVRVEMGADRRLVLEVPGLAEKRPSVIVGDMVDIRVHEDHTAYRGIIQRVNDKTVEIDHLDEDFVNYMMDNPTMELDVRFVLGRLPLERMHQGVDQTVANGIAADLFPDYSLSQKVFPKYKTIQTFFNNKVSRNEEQKTAVQNILNCTSMHAPYIVFGPPGTGKTVTIVEAIVQIMKNTNKKILVCAPANAACDMLTEKLMMYCKRSELIRVMSENVDRQNLKQHILHYTNYQDGNFPKPTVEELCEYRIVITTLILIGRYSKKYHPDVVFIDEAAQPCEPEACCALGTIAHGKQIILAGDHKQLGPTVASKVAGEYGFGKSLLERLMSMELYRNLNPNFITMLKLNFRSHYTILTLPNVLFYNNQLQACSVKSNSDPLATICVFEQISNLYRTLNGAKKRKPGQAIEFCSIISQESRQGRSPSYFNNKEMQMVRNYVHALINLRFDNEEDKVTADQIGVVTPYIRQVYKIRGDLSRAGFEGVEVGTTEAFQGREKRVIIISTVRAKHNLLAYDKKYNLGFVKHEKRFNVALTRAMSKLIVIGCAHVLGTDEKWLSYMQLCKDWNVFCGTPDALRTEKQKQIIVERLGGVHFVDSQHNRPHNQRNY